MTTLGADTDALERVARALHGLGGRLDATLDGLAAEVAAAPWVGADADRFRDEWSRSVRPGARRVAGSLRAAGSAAARQAAEQERASRGDDVAGVPDRGAPVRTAAESVGPFPSRMRVVTLELGGGEGIAGVFTDRVRIEDLGGGRSRVTSEVGAGLGGGVGWGNRVSASVGDRSVSAGVAVDGVIAAGVHLGTSWVVPNDRVDDLLVQIAASHVDVRASDRFRTVDRMAPGLGRVADAVGLGGMWDRLTYTPPQPDRLEVGIAGLADLDMGAHLGGSVSAGGLVAAAGSAMVAVARHPSTGETSVRVVGDGAAEAVLGERTASGRGVATTTVTFGRDGRPARLEVERTVSDGDRAEVDRWTRRLDDGMSSWQRQSSSYRVVGAGALDLGVGPVSVGATYEDLRRDR